jgi:hypothetical protein
VSFGLSVAYLYPFINCILLLIPLILRLASNRPYAQRRSFVKLTAIFNMIAMESADD